MKKPLDGCKHSCSKVEPKHFRSAADPLPGDGHYLHLQTQFGEDQSTQFRVIV